MHEWIPTSEGQTLAQLVTAQEALGNTVLQQDVDNSRILVDTPSGGFVGDTVSEAEIVLADNTTNNASETKHGFLPKLSGEATEFLNGEGEFAEPSGGGGVTGTISSLLLSSTEVNLNEGTAAKQPLYTCPANRRCIVTNIVLHKPSAFADAAIASIGWDAGGFGDVAVFDCSSVAASTTQALSLTIPDMTALGDRLKAAAVVGAAADILGLTVNTPQGSALTARCDVFGYLTDTNGVPVANVLVP